MSLELQKRLFSAAEFVLRFIIPIGCLQCFYDETNQHFIALTEEYKWNECMDTHEREQFNTIHNVYFLNEIHTNRF